MGDIINSVLRESFMAGWLGDFIQMSKYQGTVTGGIIKYYILRVSIIDGVKFENSLRGK